MTGAIILVMDSFGIGATADADKFGDVGANTLGSIACERAGKRPLALPNLARLGLFRADEEISGEFPLGCVDADVGTGAYGFAKELSSGKDTPGGYGRLRVYPCCLTGVISQKRRIHSSLNFLMR